MITRVNKLKEILLGLLKQGVYHQVNKKNALLEVLKLFQYYRADTRKIEYPLHEILFITLFALLKDEIYFQLVKQ